MTVQRYRNHHVSQYDPGCSTRTRQSGCTWTSGRNGADAATAGRTNRTPDQILALVKPSEETSPSTPGWSLNDLDKAMGRLGVPFDNRSGQGWAGVVKALDAGCYVVLQGDSDQFGNDTCSGAFNGDHAIGVHPDTDARGRQRTDDPICPDTRWEYRSTLRRYAEKFSPSVRFGVFPNAVPIIAAAVVVPNAPKPNERNAMIASAYGITTERVMRLAKSQPLFRHPGGPVVTKMAAEAEVAYVGHAGGSGDDAWGAVIVRTKVPYADGQFRPTGLYVPLKAGPIRDR